MCNSGRCHYERQDGSCRIKRGEKYPKDAACSDDYLTTCAVCGEEMYSSEAVAHIAFQGGHGGEVKDFCSDECYAEHKSYQVDCAEYRIGRRGE
jgi:hypothetical protein